MYVPLSIVDECVCEEMIAMNRVFNAHRKLSEDLEDVPPFFPEEILANHDNLEIIENMWKNYDYEKIMEEYVQVWIRYFSYVYDEPTVFEVEDFMSGKVRVYLGL